MNNTIKFFVDKKDSDLRVDIYLSNKINKLTRSYIKKIIKRQLINNQEKLLEIMVVQTEEKVVEDGRKCFKYVYGRIWLWEITTLYEYQYSMAEL